MKRIDFYVFKNSDAVYWHCRGCTRITSSTWSPMTPFSDYYDMIQRRSTERNYTQGLDVT